jgi:hypothetical protein
MCIIDHDNKLIYITVPKTGTTSTIDFLMNIVSNNSTIITNNIKNINGLKKHNTAMEIRNIISNYSEYKSFAVIRNPYDWYVSKYEYRKRNGCSRSTNNMTFNDFIKQESINSKEIVSYVSDNDGNIIVDIIIKYEDDVEKQIKQIISNIASQKSKNIFPKKNVSRENQNYANYYDDETKNIVKIL